jgi:hypothetical protein
MTAESQPYFEPRLGKKTKQAKAKTRAKQGQGFGNVINKKGAKHSAVHKSVRPLWRAVKGPGLRVRVST